MSVSNQDRESGSDSFNLYRVILDGRNREAARPGSPLLQGRGFTETSDLLETSICQSRGTGGMDYSLTCTKCVMKAEDM